MKEITVNECNTNIPMYWLTDLDSWKNKDQKYVRKLQRAAEDLLDRDYSMAFILRKLVYLRGFEEALNDPRLPMSDAKLDAWEREIHAQFDASLDDQK